MIHEIIDAHVHLPVADELKDFVGKKNKLNASLLDNNIHAAIVISDSEIESTIGSTNDCVNLFRDSPNIFIMAGISPLIDYRNKLHVIERYLSKKEVIGLKIYPGHEHFYANDPRLEDALALCEKYDVPFAIHTGWSHADFNRPDLILDLALRHPDNRFIYCHIGFPNTDYSYEITKHAKNIYYDISSLAHNQNSLNETILVLQKIADEHPQRLIFGSDYGACSQSFHIDMINQLCISETTRSMIFSTNAKSIYNLSIRY